MAIGMDKEEFLEEADEVRDEYEYHFSAKLAAIANLLEEQEEDEEIFKPSYDELYNVAIERLARIYDDAIVAHVKLRTKNVLDLVQYKEFQSEKAFVISIFNKNVMEVMRDVRAASSLLEFYF